MDVSPAREIQAESLIGRGVRDANGEWVGRIEDLVARDEGGALRVRYFLVGPLGSASRLVVGNYVPYVLRLLGVGTRAESYEVPWELMDLRDPQNPRVRGAKSGLKKRTGRAPAAPDGRERRRRAGRHGH